MDIWVCNAPHWEHQSSGLWTGNFSLRNTRPPKQDASPNTRFLASWLIHSLAYNCDRRGRSSQLFLLDERRDSSVNLRVYRPADRSGSRGVTTGLSRSVGSSSCATGTDVALNTWVSVLNDEAGFVDPVGVFWSGTRAGDNNVFTRGGSIPSVLLEKGNKIDNRADSSLMETRTERPLLSRANTGSSLAKYLGVSGWPSHTSNLPPPRDERKCLRGSAVHTSERPSPPGQGEGRMSTFVKKGYKPSPQLYYYATRA